MHSTVMSSINLTLPCMEHILPQTPNLGPTVLPTSLHWQGPEGLGDIGQWLVHRDTNGWLHITLKLDCGWMLVGGPAMPSTSAFPDQVVLAAKAMYYTPGGQEYSLDFHPSSDEGIVSCAHNMNKMMIHLRIFGPCSVSMADRAYII